MNINFKFVLVALLFGISSTANAEGVGGYIGAGFGVPSVAYGSSSLAFKMFGGYKVHQFPIPNAGAIDLAIQGEYVDFGNSSAGNSSWTNSTIGVAAIGSWIIPKKWAGWAEEKIAVIAKAGGASTSTQSNSGNSYTYTGLTHGVGAEYRFMPMFAARLMIEQYPGAYTVHSISGMFRF